MAIFGVILLVLAGLLMLASPYFIPYMEVNEDVVHIPEGEKADSNQGVRRKSLGGSVELGSAKVAATNELTDIAATKSKETA